MPVLHTTFALAGAVERKLRLAHAKNVSSFQRSSVLQNSGAKVRHALSLPMLIGYARVSTVQHNLDRQLGALRVAGCVKIFSEKASGKAVEGRPALARAIDTLGTGDVLVLSEWDRCTRSMIDGIGIMQRVAARGAAIKVLDKPHLDLTTKLGQGLLALLSALAEDERERIIQRRERWPACCEEGRHKVRKEAKAQRGTTNTGTRTTSTRREASGCGGGDELSPHHHFKVALRKIMSARGFTTFSNVENTRNPSAQLIVASRYALLRVLSQSPVSSCN